VSAERDIDSLAELFIEQVHRINARTQRRAEKSMPAEFRRVDDGDAILVPISEATLKRHGGAEREVVFPLPGGEQSLRDVVAEFKTPANPVGTLPSRPSVRSNIDTSYCDPSIGRDRGTRCCRVCATRGRHHGSSCFPVYLSSCSDSSQSRLALIGSSA
jgi:hypothetical protein